MVGDTEVIWGSNHFDSELLLPFQSGDFQRAVDGGGDEIFSLQASARVVACRLDLLGFTMPAAARAYAEGVPAWPFHDVFPQDLKAWQQTVVGRDARIRARQEARCTSFPAGPISEQESHEDLLWEDTILGFPNGDFLTVLRALVDAASPDTIVRFDLTDLVGGGYVEDDGSDLWSVPDGRVPVVVLTEGKSDARLLKESLDTLLPEYASYLRFLDYDFARAAGGVGEVVRFVRMFAGSGIKNRVIALFDNDAAGQQAFQELGVLSGNVVTMCLPKLPLFESYPSIGPDGPGMSNVDGRACSLELYLGRHALTAADGNLRPVRWTAFNEKLGRYQGEVSGKREVQDAFEEILGLVRSDPARRADYDFSGVEAIFEAMFAALASR